MSIEKKNNESQNTIETMQESGGIIPMDFFVEIPQPDPEPGLQYPMTVYRKLEPHEYMAELTNATSELRNEKEECVHTVCENLMPYTKEENKEEQARFSHVDTRELCNSDYVPIASVNKLATENVLQIKNNERHHEGEIIGKRVSRYTKITPYEIAKRFMKLIPLIIIGKSIFYYNGRYYQKATPLEIQKLIYRSFPSEIEEVGFPKFVRDVCDFLIMEPSLQRIDLMSRQKEISFLNGILNIETKEFYPHTSTAFTTYLLNCNYIPFESAICPCFDAFLVQVTGGDVELQRRILEMIGYIISPDTEGKVMFLLQGCSNSGKTILASLITSFFNDEAVDGLDIHSLSERFTAAELEGKAICVSSDLPAGRLDVKSTSKLKQLSGNDMVSADVKYSDRVRFYCHAKFLLVTNHALLTRERDDAFLERIVVVPFNYSVPKQQRDRMLLSKLKGEKEAIIAKSLYAYFRVKNNGYRFSGIYEINDAIEECENEEQEFYILAYLKNNFEPSEDEGIFLCAIHADFCEKYGEIPINVFSEKFFENAHQLFGAVKGRKRRNSRENPRSFILGIKYKER